jgi:hypothetical protein
MVPSWWRHRRDARRLAPAAPVGTGVASHGEPPSSQFAPEHPPREGL